MGTPNTSGSSGVPPVGSTSTDDRRPLTSGTNTHRQTSGLVVTMSDYRCAYCGRELDELDEVCECGSEDFETLTCRHCGMPVPTVLAHDVETPVGPASLCYDCYESMLRLL